MTVNADMVLHTLLRTSTFALYHAVIISRRVASYSTALDRIVSSCMVLHFIVHCRLSNANAFSDGNEMHFPCVHFIAFCNELCTAPFASLFLCNKSKTAYFNTLLNLNSTKKSFIEDNYLRNSKCKSRQPYERKSELYHSLSSHHVLEKYILQVLRKKIRNRVKSYRGVSMKRQTDVIQCSYSQPCKLCRCKKFW